jgi:ribosome maturation factor RimP
MASGAAQREKLSTVIEPAVRAAGCDLEEVSVSPAGRRKVVRIVVASDNGVTLDEVADVSRAVTEVLDARDTELFGASPYVLEVTSPGVDRPLTEPRHWRRAVGRLVEVAVDGTDTRARVTDADDDGVELTDEAGTATRAAWAQLGQGRVQVEFGRATDEDDEEEEEDS